MAQQESAATFDVSRIADLSEYIVANCLAAQVTPLVREPGRLVVTQARLYFQPLHNLGEDSPVRSIPLTAVAGVARRTHALRPRGVELFLKADDSSCRSSAGGLSGGGSLSVFYVLSSSEEREALVAQLHQLLKVRTAPSSPPLPSSAPSQSHHDHGVPQALSVDSAAAAMLLEGKPEALTSVTASWQVGPPPPPHPLPTPGYSNPIRMWVAGGRDQQLRVLGVPQHRRWQELQRLDAVARLPVAARRLQQRTPRPHLPTHLQRPVEGEP